MSELSFSCQRCGHCCHGKGGIIVSPKDLERLCHFFELSAEDFLKKYTKDSQKPHLITGEDDFCLFFKEGVGCSIHEARPDVCRAWPYFRGNIVDATSFEMAKEDCKGINQEISHAGFAQDGYKYLVDYNLLATDPKTEGRALIVCADEVPTETK